MEYRLDGATVRVHTHFLDYRRYIVRRGDYEGDAYTLSGAEEKIRHLIKGIKETFKSELDSYERVREAVFDLAVPAEVYQGANQ